MTSKLPHRIVVFERKTCRKRMASGSFCACVNRISSLTDARKLPISAWEFQDWILLAHIVCWSNWRSPEKEVSRYAWAISIDTSHADTQSASKMASFVHLPTGHVIEFLHHRCRLNLRETWICQGKHFLTLRNLNMHLNKGETCVRGGKSLNGKKWQNTFLLLVDAVSSLFDAFPQLSTTHAETDRDLVVRFPTALLLRQMIPRFGVVSQLKTVAWLVGGKVFVCNSCCRHSSNWSTCMYWHPTGWNTARTALNSWIVAFLPILHFLFCASSQINIFCYDVNRSFDRQTRASCRVDIWLLGRCQSFLEI